MTLNAVVLPAPFGPIRPKIVCGCTSKLTSSSATMPPKRREASLSESRATTAENLLPFEILAPELLHRRLARRGGVDGVVRRVVDGPHDEMPLLVHVEDGDAARRLLEAAEERRLPEERAADDRPVDRPVEDEEQDVPGGVVEDRLDRGNDPVVELAIGLAAQEAAVERQRLRERAGHHRLH